MFACKHVNFEKELIMWVYVCLIYLWKKVSL